MKQQDKKKQNQDKKTKFFDHFSDKELLILLKKYPDFYLCLNNPSHKIQNKYVSIIVKYYVKNFEIIDDVIIPNLTSIEALIKLSEKLEKLKNQIITKNKYKTNKNKFYALFKFLMELRINTSIEKIKDNKNYNNLAKHVLELIENEIS